VKNNRMIPLDDESPILAMLGGKYRQTAKKDIWLPVIGAGLSFFVRVLLPPIMVAVWAALVGRAAGPIAIAGAALVTAGNRTVPPAKRAPTWIMWIIGGGLTLCWILGAWPVPPTVISFAFLKSLEAATYGRWQPMWSIGQTAYVPMGAWFFWRMAIAIALPIGTPAPWSALNWRTLTEIVAPIFAESIRHHPAVEQPAEDAAQPRETSALPTSPPPRGLF
jgi:hypothetical protein